LQVIPVDQAIAIIQDSDTIVIGGSGGGHAVAESLIVALARRYLATGRPNNISILHPVGIGDGIDQGVNHLAHEGLLKRIVTGAWLLDDQA
jgi:propionate CoA-transferase